MTTTALEHWLEATLREPRQVAAADRRMLEKLTVVVPCYGRQDFLLRQCAYWHGSGATVVIVDGSERPLPQHTQDIMTTLGDIHYLHAAISMMERLKLAAGRVATPYAILLGDDEFLLYGGLASAIRQLEGNASLVACIAQSLAFYPPAAGCRCTYGEGYPHWRYAVLHDEPGQRLQAAMSDYTAATCYAVLRTPVWQRSWGQLRNWSSPYVGEMQQGITTYIWGKLTTVDEVYWMRSSENRPVTNQGFNRGVSFQEWWESPKFSTEHKEFLQILKNELVQAEPDSTSRAEAVVADAVKTYVNHLNTLTAQNSASLTTTQTSLQYFRQFGGKLVKACLPQSIVANIKSLRFANSTSAQCGSLGTLDDLQRNGLGFKFSLSAPLSSEILGMESLTESFYEARLGQRR